MSITLYSHIVIEAPVVNDVYEFLNYQNNPKLGDFSPIELIKYISSAFQVFDRSFLYKLLRKTFEKDDKYQLKLICDNYRWDYDRIPELFDPELSVNLPPDEKNALKSELTKAHMYAGSQHLQISIRESNFDDVLIEKKYNKNEKEHIRNIYGTSKVLTFLRTYNQKSELCFVFFTQGIGKFAPQVETKTSTLNHVAMEFYFSEQLVSKNHNTILDNERIYNSLNLMKNDLEHIIITPRPKSKTNIFKLFIILMIMLIVAYFGMANYENYLTL